MTQPKVAFFNQLLPVEEGDYIAGKTDLVNEIIDKSGFVRWKPPEA